MTIDTALTTVLTGAVAALWAKLWSQGSKHELAIRDAVDAERRECTNRLNALEARIVKIEQQHSDDATRLRNERDDWIARWEREVGRRVIDYNAPAPGAPARPPMPSIDEEDIVRERRAAITERALREYVESRRPPRRDSPIAMPAVRKQPPPLPSRRK